MNTQEQIKQKLEELNEKFSNLDTSAVIDKNITTREFIKPLFEALGWDFDTKKDEVIGIEEISKERADYVFHIEGIPKFFLKTASINENLENKDILTPVTTYAFNKGITWAIITNFKKIKILNSEVQGKTPGQMQFIEIEQKDFINKFEQLSYLQKKSFELGILDNEAEYFSKKRKRTPIDKQLLDDLLKFTSELIVDIEKNNSKKNLTNEEINEAVHRMLNRIIFMRACGDRGLEQKHLIMNLREWEETKNKKLVDHLREIFKYFKENYGGTIFTHHLCDELEISNSTLKNIIERLYISEDKSISYDFSIIESDILGSMYEQYLRYFRSEEEELRIGSTHRKKQGIFYTPNFVVKYIINKTIGEKIKNKKFDLSKIRILDPACGSGSFLIKSYDFIYNHQSRKDKKFHQTHINSEIEGGVYSNKVKILKENLFGVDLDKIATEIIQLNLLLKITEKKHHLPILQQNIRLGNSLIENSKIDPIAFKWEEEFHQILKNEKGFDCIIGNPPYVRQEKFAKIKPALKEKYSVYTGTADLYVYFFEKSIQLLKSEGIMGFIVSNKWLRSKYGKKLRKLISAYWIEEIIDFEDSQIFKDATTYPCVIIFKKILKKNPKIKICKIKGSSFFNLEKYVKENFFIYDQNKLEEDQWRLLPYEVEKIVKKMEKNTITLKEFTNNKIFRGISTGNNDVFIIDKVTKDKLKDEKSNKIIKKIVMGKEVKKHNIQFEEKYLLYLTWDYKLDFSKSIKKYLLINKKELETRPEVKEKRYSWWCLSRYGSKSNEFLAKPKIIYPRVCNESNFALDSSGEIYLSDNNFFISNNSKILLGILNSKPVFYYLKQICPHLQGGYFDLRRPYIEKIPIPKKIDKEEEIEMRTDKILTLHEKMKKSKIKKEQEEFLKKIAYEEREIDKITYEMYGINENEIKIIEKSFQEEN